MTEDAYARLRRDDAPDLGGQRPGGGSATAWERSRAQETDPYDRLAMPRRPGNGVVRPTTRSVSWAEHAARTDKNWMAIVSLVCSLMVAAPLEIRFGHLALAAQARGEANNSGMAMAGLVIGYLVIAGGLLWLIFA